MSGHQHHHEHDPGAPHAHGNEHSPAHTREHGGMPGHADGHEHDKTAGEALRTTPLRRLVIACVLTFGFMFVEAGVGWWSNSLALVADAGHMLADGVALGLAIVAQRIASQTRTRARTYGFRRAEVLAAFGNGVAL